MQNEGEEEVGRAAKGAENERVEEGRAYIGRLTHAGDGLKTRRKRDETTILANGRA